jgi:hypothetical protein
MQLIKNFSHPYDYRETMILQATAPKQQLNLIYRLKGGPDDLQVVPRARG